MESEDVAALVAALEADPGVEKTMVAVSKGVGLPGFSTEFLARGGLWALFRALQSNSASRSARTNALRALALLLDEPAGRAALRTRPASLTSGLLHSLLVLVMSDSVLNVARALHVLSALTEPGVVEVASLNAAFSLAAQERGRGLKPMACLRCAFVGFALLDANIHGLSVAKNLLELDGAANLPALEEALVCQAIFPLCENEGLTRQINCFQAAMCKCWRDRAAIGVVADLPEHAALLERLWTSAVFPARPFPGKSSPEWRLLGFQGDTPASDFRSMGLFALEQLVYFVETCSTEARMIFSLQNTKDDAESYYPVATAGILVSSMVLAAVEGRVKSGGVVPVVLAEGVNKIWVAVLRHIDTIFVECKLTYLQFGELTKVVTQQLGEALAQNPLSVVELAGLLKAAADSSPSFGGSGRKKRTKALSAQWMAQSTLRGGGPASLGSSSGGGVGGGSLGNNSGVGGAGGVGGAAAGAGNVAGKPNVLVLSGGDIVPSMMFSATPAKTIRGHGRETKAVGKKLRKACSEGDAKRVIEILGKEKGEGYALVNDPEPETRLTPLHLACLGGHADCVTLICGAGAALESVAAGLGGPLHCAAGQGSVAVARILLEAGAKVNAATAPDNRTPLMMAAAAGNGEMCQFLVGRGADIDLTDAEGKAAGNMWNGGSDVAQILGNRRKRSSMSHVNFSPGELSKSAGSSPRLDREVKVLRAENHELRALIQDLTARVVALEGKTHK